MCDVWARHLCGERHRNLQDVVGVLEQSLPSRVTNGCCQGSPANSLPYPCSTDSVRLQIWSIMQSYVYLHACSHISCMCMCAAAISGTAGSYGPELVACT
jgi:hypothetical protein